MLFCFFKITAILNSLHILIPTRKKFFFLGSCSNICKENEKQTIRFSTICTFLLALITFSAIC